ncbi:PD-(D/E)XK nuclease family protein [Cognatitamlana onchidii]|uniref:PD-(D/E)XK nuclease family protein n=1 Tax=Cognatitamlana onchidii TaxID=2562860 RepID=UPI0010A5EB70|nr:PD-(D/E)XK nuclease family protein [Algibacter onchidii]
MSTFILDVLKDLKKQNKDFSKLTFILPSKRAGLFLKHQLPHVLDQTIFSPNILSIEEFVEVVSQLKTVSNTELLFEFYDSYLNLTRQNDQDSFEVFSKWSQILLQDFNEIDRYLIPQEQIFNYLHAIEDLKHWSLEEHKTDFVKKYLAFWNTLPLYYKDFTHNLKQKQIGYQGLVYREAVKNLSSYITNNPKKHYVFLGFNALNTCEEHIIQELLEHNLAQIYWDIDKTFLKNEKHDAGLFIRKHLNNWKYFEKAPFNWPTGNYSNPKTIGVFGVPKNIGQAKHIGSLLKTLKNQTNALQNTAVVLGDESLLIPVLNSIPKGIDSLNITMGLPLGSIPLGSLFEALFKLHKSTTKTFYFKDVINIISNQFIRPLLNIDGIDYASQIIESIEHNNIAYLNVSRITQIARKCETIINLLFSNWGQSINNALKNCFQLILLIKDVLDKDKQSNLLSLEYLFRFNELFNEVSRLNSKYKHIKDLHTLYNVYKDLLATESLDFQGEPLQGLQIMGMLESRVLDFETVIISSVNEGILPSGKSNNSFIPFDVKLEHALPTYKEKDAVYTYHFYRLLQRAKNIYILYNTEADVLTGGEKSRFITQLELEQIRTLNHQIITPKIPIIEQRLSEVKKTPALHQAIIDMAKNGFSPSSLTNYIRNPMDFYYQKILKIGESNDVEETIAFNTLGTVVHNTLEEFYKPLEGTYLSLEVIKQMKTKIHKRVTYYFQNEYKEGDITKGKNLIIYEIAKRYVANFLDFEEKSIKSGNDIKILAIEADNQIKLNISNLNYPIALKGKIDRVDEVNGITRIIDYKTGSVSPGQVEIVNWGELTSDYKKYSKSFQVLSYAYMMYKSGQISLPIEAGIISFKSLNSGFIKFSKKDSPRSRTKHTMITQDTLEAFEEELKNLISDICNPEINFIEKEI